MVQINIKINENIYKEFQKLCIDRKTNVSRAIIKFIEKELTSKENNK